MKKFSLLLIILILLGISGCTYIVGDEIDTQQPAGMPDFTNIQEEQMFIQMHRMQNMQRSIRGRSGGMMGR